MFSICHGLFNVHPWNIAFELKFFNSHQRGPSFLTANFNVLSELASLYKAYEDTLLTHNERPKTNNRFYADIQWKCKWLGRLHFCVMIILVYDMRKIDKKNEKRPRKNVFEHLLFSISINRNDDPLAEADNQMNKNGTYHVLCRIHVVMYYTRKMYESKNHLWFIMCCILWGPLSPTIPSLIKFDGNVVLFPSKFQQSGRYKILHMTRCLDTVVVSAKMCIYQVIMKRYTGKFIVHRI